MPARCQQPLPLPPTRHPPPTPPQEKERLASERIQVLQSKASALDAALGAARAEVKSLHERLEGEAGRCAGLEEAGRRQQHQAELLQGQLQDLQQALQRAQVGPARLPAAGCSVQLLARPAPSSAQHSATIAALLPSQPARTACSSSPAPAPSALA